MTQYADWKAPRNDEEHLIWPAGARIVASTRANSERLSRQQSVLIQGAPLSELRQATRRAVGISERPLIATGHQIEMYHPGVWVKNILIDTVAKKLNGTALHIAVDTDSPKHLQLRWCGHSHLMSDDATILDGAWSGLVAPPASDYFHKITSAFRDSAQSWSFEPAIEPFFNGFEQSLNALTLGDAVIAGATKLDQSLGLDVRFLTASRLLESDGYLAFVHHVVADIERFARQYNMALADYRREQGIRSTTRPMPDLQVEESVIEIPFWLDDLETQERSRAVVVRNGKHWALAAAGAMDFELGASAPVAIDRLRAHLRQSRLRLAPRALTLTLFMRLMLVDQFVHGIGGARYDQVTDRIIQNYFGMEAPAFCVTTATLYCPDAGQQQSRVCIPCLLIEGHRLRHNPTPAKHSHLSAIEAAPRGSSERKSRYLSMHRELAIAASKADVIPQWKERLEQALRRRDEERVLFDRELFYGIQSRSRLTDMIERYRIAFA